jgi:metal-sulfur cluster biosynthetic enzyme
VAPVALLYRREAEGWRPELLEGLDAVIALPEIGVPGIAGCSVTMVFDPPWDQSRMSDEARIALDMWCLETVAPVALLYRREAEGWRPELLEGLDAVIALPAVGPEPDVGRGPHRAGHVVSGFSASRR